MFQITLPGTDITGMCNVRDFGVKGDGTTDDAPALNAITSDPKNINMALWFPPGRYKINDVVHFRGGQKAFGAGTGPLGNYEISPVDTGQDPTSVHYDDFVPCVIDARLCVGAVSAFDYITDNGGGWIVDGFFFLGNVRSDDVYNEIFGAAAVCFGFWDGIGDIVGKSISHCRLSNCRIVGFSHSIIATFVSQLRLYNVNTLNPSGSSLVIYNACRDVHVAGCLFQNPGSNGSSQSAYYPANVKIACDNGTAGNSGTLLCGDITFDSCLFDEGAPGVTIRNFDIRSVHRLTIRDTRIWYPGGGIGICMDPRGIPSATISEVEIRNVRIEPYVKGATQKPLYTIYIADPQPGETISDIRLINVTTEPMSAGGIGGDIQVPPNVVSAYLNVNGVNRGSWAGPLP